MNSNPLPNPDSEARNIVEQYFTPTFTAFDIEFVPPCKVDEVSSLRKSIEEKKVPAKVKIACSNAEKHLAKLWTNVANRDALIQTTRLRVSQLLFEHKNRLADAELQTRRKRDPSNCPTIEDWAKAQLSASIAAGEFGSWPRTP